jgi:hypothetical protein
MLVFSRALCIICLFEFIRVEDGVKLMKHFKEGLSYNSVGTSGLIYTNGFQRSIMWKCGLLWPRAGFNVV